MRANGTGLTERDFAALRAMAEHGTRARSRKYRGGRPGPDYPEAYDVLDSDDPIAAPWRGGDGRRGVTLELCNAIRCAAEDGLSYGKIADLYPSVTRSTAREHATGNCPHGRGEIPPVGPRPSGYPSPVSREECDAMRRRRDRGETYGEIADAYGRSVNAAYRHVNGECSHRE